MGTAIISTGLYQRVVVLYVYVPFDVLPFIGFRNNLAIEGGSGMRHVEYTFVSLLWLRIFWIMRFCVPGSKVNGTRLGFYILALPIALTCFPTLVERSSNPYSVG